MDPTAVLDFWFLPADHFQHGRYRLEWFLAADEFATTLRDRFGAAMDTALANGFGDWEATADGSLARILLLDMFPRIAFRDTPRAFAGDARALAAARQLVATGADKALPPLKRWFAYLPFEHSESATVQQESLALFRALHAEGGKPLCSALDYAERHHQVIERFGRFPQRNAALGRASTTEEAAALRHPGFFF
ncbi:MAG: DUF924 domain-containing protein [Gammaproteobacteria bacterium]|nr:DUF924 domain-containing protein [Gammaproteobacteria bacterium]MBU1644888.1 DUF924 domain-containing protein [Gammaproteobacteria bacterium]MBU1971347.1 DUF924 domain-containing protein [Gammaproteobacteria bacterium]